MSTRYVLLRDSAAVHEAHDVGGKAHNLSRLASVRDVTVPPWFVLGTAAFDGLVLRGRALPADPAETRAMQSETLALALPDALRAELSAALAATGLADATLAVRSSATVEDAATASFAGQFTSVLGVRASRDQHMLWDAIRTVWASVFDAHAMAYASTGAAGTRTAMAVLIQELVPARAAGVAFSVDPVSGDRDVCVVSAVYGLGEQLVSGDADADTFHVRSAASGDAGIRTTTAHKERALLRSAAGGTTAADVPPPLRDTPAITARQAERIARVARAIAEHFGAPQDLEWASGRADDASALAPRDDEPLYILQARPVTAMAVGRIAEGERRIWDNSNIVESYSGVTTPLTFSFARHVYEHVYRQFCAVLGIVPEVIDEHEHVFANMLGLIRGRVYYNLLNWYRVLALLPGYEINRDFMERMMGVRERLTAPPPPPRASARWRDGRRVVRSLWGLAREHRRLDGEVAAFFRRTEAALGPLETADLRSRPADELVALYRRLERDLLFHWRAPLVNDFFAMIWFGVLGRLVDRWLAGAPPTTTLANDLLVGEGGIVSTEPARRIMAIAAMVRSNQRVRAFFEDAGDKGALLASLRREPAARDVVAELDSYLRRFGDRCVGELKLETVTASEDPSFVLRMVAVYCRQGQVDPEAAAQHERDVRGRAEREVRSRLTGARRFLFFKVLANARRRIRDRENLRFERTRVFGAVRRIFAALGHRLTEQGVLREPRQVFYLTTDEVFGVVAGTGVTRDLHRVAALRKDEFAAFEREPSPPDRFETIGPPDAPPPVAAPDDAAGDTMSGTGCCPGVVRAPVRVVRDPAEAGDLAGHILVAERTDPGWTLLFPTASGLLVQRGSLLSHSAIVAREVGLPCVVAIPGLMDELRDGEWVEMDGTTGVVRRVQPPAETAA